MPSMQKAVRQSDPRQVIDHGAPPSAEDIDTEDLDTLVELLDRAVARRRMWTTGSSQS
jgi:hypothetical protein